MKLFSLIYIFLLLGVSGLKAELSSFSLEGEGAVLMNAKTGAILFEKKAHEPIFPASTTKMATALYVIKLHKDKINDKVTVQSEAIGSISPQAKRQSSYRSPPHWIETDSTHIGIKKGEEFVLKDLLYAMLVSSANDASNVIAQYIGGTIEKFMEDLNVFLKEMGCKNTSFNNPHGLHHPEHVTTPYDLALIAREAIKDPLFREIVSTAKYICPQTNLQYERTFLQTNLLLRGGSYFYPKAFGIKTGSTDAAGKNLVSAAEDQGRELIAVTMGYTGTRDKLYRNVIDLFETAFSQPKMMRYLLPKGPQKMTKKISGARGTLKTYLPDGLYYVFYPDNVGRVKTSVFWDIPPLPIAKGARVGILQIVDEEGICLQRTPLFALQELKQALWYRVLLFFTKNIYGKKILFGGGLCLMALLLFMKRRRGVA
ncbi:MAG: D-alanyl-D-alanine carboxypeptidase family protein [Chlamydiales bacterium]